MCLGKRSYKEEGDISRMWDCIVDISREKLVHLLGLFSQLTHISDKEEYPMRREERGDRTDSFPYAQVATIVAAVDDQAPVYTLEESGSAGFGSVILEIGGDPRLIDIHEFGYHIERENILYMECSEYRKKDVICRLADMYLRLRTRLIDGEMRYIDIRHRAYPVEYRFPVDILPQ